MWLSLTQFRESDSFKGHCDDSKVPQTVNRFHSVFGSVWNTEKEGIFSTTWLRYRHTLIKTLFFSIFSWVVLFLIAQVAGIKGMFLANKKTDNQVKTHITYNRGRDWSLLQAPSKDLKGNSIHCVLVSVCVSAGPLPRSYVLSPVCALPSKRGLDRSWLIPAAMREAELRKSSSRQSWVLWGCWAERSAILIQSNKPLKNQDKEVSDRKGDFSFFRKDLESCFL